MINSLGCRKEGLNEPRSKGGRKRGQIKQTDAQKEGWMEFCLPCQKSTQIEITGDLC